MGTNNLTLSLDALVRAVQVNRNVSHTLFLGAGTSITSGVPSVSKCIWEWKRHIFLTNNWGLEEQFRDLTLTSSQEKIQRWLDSEGHYPPLNSPEEYGCYVELCYPIPDDRRQYFQELAAAAKPHLGYHLLCLLAEAGIIKATWTTNFDSLVARTATAYNLTPIEVGLDTPLRTVRPVRNGELLCVALHGEYRYDALKNTEAELKEQNGYLADAFTRYVRNAHLIVIGYSGRDDSVMAMLTSAYSQPGPGRLYWCGHERPEPDGKIQSLLEVARAHGREAYYVDTTGFDDLMRRMALHCLRDDLLARAKQQCALHPESAHSPPFAVANYPTESVVRSNSFLIQPPSEVLQFKSANYRSAGAWRRLKDRVRDTNVVAGLLGGNVIALGTVDDVKAAFKDEIEDRIVRAPIDEKELSITDGVVVSLLTRALVRAFATTHGLDTDGRETLWQKASSTWETVYGTRCRVHDAVLVFLRQYGGSLYLVLKPTIRGANAAGEPLPVEIEQELRRKVLSSQWNPRFSQALNVWQRLLLPGQSTTYEFPPNAGSTFRFVIRKATALARIGAPRPKYPVRVPANVQSLFAFEGTRFDEPKLRFSNRNGNGFVSDSHPIRGIVENQPYDYALTARELVRELRIGVVCPHPDAARLSAYLNSIHQRRRPTGRPEYLLEFPGFSQAFGIPIGIPMPQTTGWSTCAEPTLGMDAVRGSATLAQNIITAIGELRASSNPTVVVIYIPERWKSWEHYRTEDTSFDLHDFVKAYCVQKGIPSQFLREETLRKPDQGEILWWLALSFYTKSMLTPWVLEPLDRDTAYMGLGYSVDSSAAKAHQITLGCSHIYSADGRGLQYRLRKLEDVIFDRQGNPFMSRDDARRLGESVRQLFFEAMGDLPKRVVIHKRTYFRRDERDGLLEGLSGVGSIDMLEISAEPALRYMASRFKDGRLETDPFPIKRGTAIVLDRSRALLWVHGTATSIDPARPNFYLGKCRIPAPLVVTRHYGATPLNQIAEEILGLSKMNWNTFDMYTKVPATIQSSNAIARIGTLLQRFEPMSYDYRLFI